MTYTGLELFMEKLTQMIYTTDNPFIKNHPSILSERPQFQRLYEELGSMIQSLFPEKENDLHELEEVKNLKKRFKDVAQEAHDIVDRFVSNINVQKKTLPQKSHVFKIILNLEDVMRSIKCIKEEFISILDNRKMDSSSRTNHPKTPSPSAIGSSCNRSSLGSKKVLDEIIVGLDHDTELIRDKLVEDQKQLHVVSIVGMGGLGKTTLATKVFNDPFVVYHFHIRAWVTVSQTYKKHDLLIQILESFGSKVDTLRDNYSRLREMLHKILMSNRYLIVIDDIWKTEAWDDLKVIFPNNHTGSRIFLTSRLKEVALYASPNGFIHHLEYLTNEESWELLRKKVFHGNDCPSSLIEAGKKIAKSCHGLPLALVAIAGVLTKEEVCKDSWERIARNVASYVVGDTNRYTDTLALSIDHLPSHLRDCFLYLGGFPEDCKFRARRLICLWMAEGFIQEARNQSMEETAEEYLMELVDRNLVLVQGRKYNGAIKTFSVHDVLRELCLEIATKESFFLRIPDRTQAVSPFKVAPYKKRCIFANSNINITNATNIRSFFSFYNYSATSYRIIRLSHSWMLLMVLDLQRTKLDFVTELISLLVHLRYLAIWYEGDFPSSICNLWSLQTLIVRRETCHYHLVLPKTISNLVNMRHLRCNRNIVFPRKMKTMNLLTIYKVSLGDGAKMFLKCVPRIKKLTCLVHHDMKYDFRSLTFLEILKIGRSDLDRYETSANKLRSHKNSISFPPSLKKLTLRECHLPWSCMSEIQSLPKLEVLNLLEDAFIGHLWDSGEEPFQQLKFLQLEGLEIKQWEASSINFPCLKQLVLKDCSLLDDIPLEFGYIPTLEHIKTERLDTSVYESLGGIQEQQHADGNFDIKITVDGKSYDDMMNLYMRYSSWNLYMRHNSWNFYKEHRGRTPRLRFFLSDIRGITTHFYREASTVPTNHPTVSPSRHDTRSSRIWINQRSKSRLLRRKFLNKRGGIRLLQY